MSYTFSVTRSILGVENTKWGCYSDHRETNMANRFRIGDKVVYTRDKYTSSPGPRAKNVSAAPNGELYQYQVDKYWTVVEILSPNHLVVMTRRQKTHVLAGDDPRLRKASLFERLLLARQFPALSKSQTLLSATPE